MKTVDNLKIQENIPLKPLTTLKLGGNVKYFMKVKNRDDIVSAVDASLELKVPIFILGGGSNVIISDNLSDRLCLKMENTDIEIISENEDEVFVRVGAGYGWDSFVEYSMGKAWYGIEALSAIPGTCGATPVQNVGAYGVEVSDLIQTVRVYMIGSRKFEDIGKKECHFSYRDSIFKHELKNSCIIESVVYKLNKKNISIPKYTGVEAVLQEVIAKYSQYTLQEQIRETIIRIRSGKLPDPKLIPNVGSFFNNPIISKELFNKLQSKHKNLPYFIAGEDYKIPAGWLIDNAGLKGYVENGVGVYEKNALVLVNVANNSSQNLLDFANLVQKKVFKKYGISLKIEPEIIT